MTQQDTLTSTPTLLAPCDGCGAPDGLPFPGSEDHYCSRCARLTGLTDTAKAQLLELARPVLEAWAGHWAGSGALAFGRESYSAQLAALLEEVITARVQAGRG